MVPHFWSTNKLHQSNWRGLKHTFALTYTHSHSWVPAPRNWDSDPTGTWVGLGGNIFFKKLPWFCCCMNRFLSYYWETSYDQRDSEISDVAIRIRILTRFCPRHILVHGRHLVIICWMNEWTLSILYSDLLNFSICAF